MNEQKNDPEQGLTRLRVVTYNTNRNDMTRERLEKVFQRIEALDGDVYGLQEYLAKNVHLLRERFGDRYTILEGDVFEDMVHHVIMIKDEALEFVQGTAFCLTLGASNGLPGKHPEAITVRMTQGVMLQKRGGSPTSRMLFAVTQLDNVSASAREEGNRQLLDYFASNWHPKLPKIYLGDMNINTQGYASTRKMQKPLLDIEEAGFYNTWTYANCEALHPPTFFGSENIQVEGMKDQDRYTYNPDHIFVSDGIHTVLCRVDSDDEDSSDHRSKYADVIMLDWK